MHFPHYWHFNILCDVLCFPVKSNRSASTSFSAVDFDLGYCASTDIDCRTMSRVLVGVYDSLATDAYRLVVDTCFPRINCYASGHYDM